MLLFRRASEGLRNLHDEGMVGDYWGSAGAGILFFDHLQRRYLLLLRSADVLDPGLWGIPGGAIPRRSTTGQLLNPWVAAQNEVLEETGKRLHDSVEPDAEVTWHAPNSSFWYKTFLVAVPTFTPRLNWESDDFGWFTQQEVRALGDELHPGVRWAFTRFRLA